MDYHNISMLYGSQEIDDFIPKDPGRVQVIESPDVPSEIDSLEDDLIYHLENPVNSPPLKDLVEEHYRDCGKKVFLLADDNTRPNIHTKILHPLILNYLQEECGVQKDDLRILIASGTHRPPTGQEIEDLILGPEIYQEYQDQVLVHDDSSNLADLGTSSRGTPITINKDAYNSCLIIPVTDSEYHYFAGVAGTVKQLFPGIAGRKTTNSNHPRMFHPQHGFTPECHLGNTEGNPVITDMKEMADFVKEHNPVFCVDAILDKGEITYLNAGDILSLHEIARDKLRARRVVPVDQPGDLVIVSVGKLGLNLYQAGKGIHAAWNAVRQPGGTILLLAPCQDGVGSAGYQETMEAVRDLPLDEALAWVLENKCSVETFRIGNQKPVDALRILKTLESGRISVLSEMDPTELEEIYRLDPIPGTENPQQALRSYLTGFLDSNPEALIYVLEDAGLFVVPGNGR
jgi:nickel-dependent lactate racemase